MNQPLRILLPCLAIMVFAAGCSYQKTLSAKRASYTYNQALKWRDYEKAASFLEKSNKGRLLANKDTLEKRLDLIEFEILNVVWDKNRRAATVEVRKRYILYPDNRYREEIVKERWKKEEGGWVIQTPIPSATTSSLPLALAFADKLLECVIF
ncbi:MAG: hypothetical protein SVK44_04655 [Nitrospirota bacterium]|nr:hypothetical protein [Nitrospirota bacterium]